MLEESLLIYFLVMFPLKQVKGERAGNRPLRKYYLPAVFFFPTSSTIIGFSIAHDEDVSFRVKIPLVFVFTAVWVCGFTPMKYRVTSFEEVGVGVSWFAHWSNSFETHLVLPSWVQSTLRA